MKNGSVIIAYIAALSCIIQGRWSESGGISAAAAADNSKRRLAAWDLALVAADGGPSVSVAG
jgi:hypothetical protein